MQRVVILGAGYAGVRAAQELHGRREGLEVVLIDRSRSHEIVTEMYKLAAGDREPRRTEVPLHRLLPHDRDLRLLQAEVESLDWRSRQVRTTRGTVGYDTALICLGASPSYYGVPGAREHALTLQYLDSAVRLRRRLRCLARAGGGRVVIVGGGLTGVELAGEITAAHPGRLQVTIAQATASLLPEEDPLLAAYAEEALTLDRVEVRRDERVERVLAHGVALTSGGVLPADLVVWSGGVQANPLPQSAGLPVDGRGRLQVLPTLEVEGHPELFAAGDVAAVPGPGGQSLPPTAQLAVQEGRQAARNILRVHAGLEPRPLRPRILGLTATLGRGQAIARLGRLRLTGRPALALHEIALLRYLYGIGGIGLLRREGYLGLTSRPMPGPGDQAIER